MTLNIHHPESSVAQSLGSDEAGTGGPAAVFHEVLKHSTRLGTNPEG